MTSTKQRSLLGETAYRNPRHEQEAAHDKALVEAKGQPASDTAEQEKQPVHNWEKRYRDLHSYNNRKINELTQQLEKANKQEVAPLKVPKTAEELAVMKRADPEGYSRIEAIAATMVQSQMSNYDQQLATVQGDLLDTKIERSTLAIKQAHPDFEQITQSDDFHGWAEKQEQTVQDWIYNNPDNPQLAIKALSLFKYETSWGNNKSNASNTNTQVNEGNDLDVRARNRADLEGEVDRNHPAYIWKESEIRKMSPTDFAKWDEHIKLAQREGRIANGQ